jgi:hypothetical protein
MLPVESRPAAGVAHGEGSFSMMDERERCLELLGLKPGASAQEIKAAYRDLAKVWHPDRFAHDSRLQEKAQNKLKEINEAYEALTSGTFNRSTRASHRSTESNTSYPATSPTQPNSGTYLWTVMCLIAGLVTAGFFIAPRLLPEAGNETGQMSVTSQPVQDTEVEKDEAASNRREKKNVEKQKAPAAVPVSGPVESTVPPRALPTVTVTIDPTTGLLATAACPIKSSMTYVGGQEPHQYCSANHQATARTEAPPEAKKKSRLKSLGDHLAAPARWLKDKTQ